MKELLDIIRMAEARRGERLALATLVAARGSSYRRPGARMLISENGRTAGSLSGGCLEEDVVACAREVLAAGVPQLLKFDTRQRFGCSGQIEIFVEKVDDDLIARVAAALRDRVRCRVMTIFHGANRGSRVLEAGEAGPEGAFEQIIEPPIHLIIFGGGHDGRPLCALADLLGWSHAEFEQAGDLPTAADDRTAAIVKSHNYGRDCAALRHLLQLGLRYVGLVGPRARRDQLWGDLIDSGAEVGPELFAPAGLDLGAEGPEEIALAIVTEIQNVFAEGSGEPLRVRKAPIHGWNLASSVAPLECRESAP